MHDRLKIKKQLLENEKISYASDVIELPKGGIDCGEGCNPYGFPPECADVVKNFDTARLGDSRSSGNGTRLMMLDRESSRFRLPITVSLNPVYRMNEPGIC